MKKRFTMLLASLFLVMGTGVAQVYQKVLHKEWTVTAFNQAGTVGNEGGVAFILDENPQTFYHSNYSGSQPGKDGLQGFMVDMGSVVSDITKITYTGRSDDKTSGWARKVRIYLYEELPDDVPADLSTVAHADKNTLFAKGNVALGTAAFDNNETGEWADNRNLKTAEFAEAKSARYVLFIMDSGHDNWLTCADFNVWQKVEDIVEDKPYFLKINGLDGNFYLDTRVGEKSDYGFTICKTETPVATYFTLTDGYWHISSYPGNEKHFVNVSYWDATVGQDTPANWYLHKDKEHSLWSLAQSAYHGGGNVANHYLGANNGDISGQKKLYTDKSLAQAVKFELVALDEKQTAAEAARVALSHTGVGYPAAGSEARATLQAAVDAAEATAESINAAIVAYQANTQTVQMPEVGKVYRLVSGLFKTKKAIYSNNTELRWQNRDVNAMNQLWTVLSISGNNITLINVNDGLCPQKTDFSTTVTMSTVKNECSFEFLGKGQFQIKANKEQGMHANSHGNGTGTNGGIINYNTGADGASAWRFEEVTVTKDILAKQIASISNSYTNSLLVKQEGLAGLQVAVEEAQAVHDADGDYANALTSLAAAMNNATIDGIDLGYFYMKSRSAQKYAYNDDTNLKVADSKSPKSVFKLIKANNGTYYIQNGNGFYPQGVGQSSPVTTASAALEYTVTRLESGYYVLRPTNSLDAYHFWHDANNGTGNIVGWSNDAENTQWTFESLAAEETEKIYTVNEFCTNSADVSVTYNGTYDGNAEVKQAGGFYVLDEAPQASDFTITNVERGKVFVNGNSLYVCEGYDATKIYTLRCLKGNSYARYHSESQLSAEDNTNMLTYEGNLYLESFFYIEKGEGEYTDYYTIRSVAAPTMYAYNLGTENKDSRVAMKEAPAEGGLTSAYYWKISNFGSKETSNITPWGEGGEAFGWNKRGGYNGKNHIGYWQGGNGYNDNKWYVNIVKDELVEKFIPLHTVANSVIGYATYESVEAVLPYTEVVTAEGINKLKNAQFNVVAPQVGKYYRLKNEVSGLYMSGDESNITLVEKEHQVSTIFYLDENYALKSHKTGRYLDCYNKDYADDDNKPAGTFGFAYGGMKPNVITYKNNGYWTFGGNSNGNLDRGSDNPNQAGYNWILEEGDVDVWEAKAELVSLIDELYDPWALPMPLQVDDAAAGYFLSSCGTADGNVEANMIDGENNTFYGSPWGASVNGIDYHYWQVDLGDGVTLKDFVFSYMTRANGNDMPTEIVVKGSVDGVTFNEIARISEGLPAAASSVYVSESIAPTAKDYRYVRFEVTGTNNEWKAGGHATQRTIAIAEFAMWHHTKPVMDAAQDVVDDKAATLDEVNQAYQNLKMMNVEKPEYPFTVTTDEENPVIYAIKSGRTNDGKEWWYTYDSGDGKIALSQYAGSNNQFWFFKEVVTADYQYALQLYPYADPAKAMSYENTNNDAGKIVAQTPGTTGWTNLWLSVSTEGTAPYGLQTFDKNNYLSNNGGHTNKMGMYNSAPNADGGTAMYYYTPAEALQNLIAQAKVLAVPGHDGEVGYYTAETAEALRAVILQAEANFEDKNYSVAELNAAIANLSMVLPETGKYYQIKSANPDFYAKQGKEMGIYSSNDQGQLAWKALDATDKSFYWAITSKDGKFIFKNEADGKFVPAIDNDAYAMTATETEAAEFTLTWLTPGQFKINNNGTMHMAGHGAGAGTGGRICGWDGGINSSSAWTIVEVEHPDLAIAKINLQARIDELNPMTEYAGTDPGYYKVEDIAKLATALAVAENALVSGGSEPATYTTALENLNNTVAELGLEVIPVTAGKYVIVNAKPAFNDSKVLTTHAVCGSSGKASTPAWAEKVSNDPLQYWEIEVENENFYLKSAYEGSYITSANSLGNEPKEAKFSWIAPGQYNITIDKNVFHANLHGWGVNSSNIISYGGGADSPSAWKLVAVSEEPQFTFDLTVGSTGYATLVLGFDAEIPEGITCYTVSVNGNYADMTSVKGDVLPANTPVIVKAEAETYTFASTDKVATTPEVNELMGSLYPKLITPDANTTCYVLAKTGETANPVAFYPIELGRDDNGAELEKDDKGNIIEKDKATSFQNGANKVYLPVNTPGGQAPALMFRFGTTEVEDMQAVPQHTLIYDLMGRPVERMEKGIYIVNGRKVVK